MDRNGILKGNKIWCNRIIPNLSFVVVVAVSLFLSFYIDVTSPYLCMSVPEGIS